MKFSEFLLEAYQVTFFHGTEAKNIQGILRNGIVLGKPHRWTGIKTLNYGSKAIFFSPDIETAARYAVGTFKHQTPAIIEFTVSKPKRFKSLEHDPMDRESDAWGHEQDQSQLYDIEHSALEIIRKYQQNIYGLSKFNDIDEDSLEKLDGFNLYKYILDQIKNSHIKQVALADIQKEFPTGQITDFLDITPTGTIRVRNEYFKSKYQFKSSKEISPNQIRSVYVRKSDFPNIKGPESNIATVLLPHESRDTLEDIKGIYFRIMDLLNNPNTDHEDIDDVINTLKEYDKDYNYDHNDLIYTLESWKAGKKSKDDVINMVYNFENEVDDKWGRSMTHSKDMWIKLNKNNPQINFIR